MGKEAGAGEDGGGEAEVGGGGEGVGEEEVGGDGLERVEERRRSEMGVAAAAVPVGRTEMVVAVIQKGMNLWFRTCASLFECRGCCPSDRNGRWMERGRAPSDLPLAGHRIPVRFGDMNHNRRKCRALLRPQTRGLVRRPDLQWASGSRLTASPPLASIQRLASHRMASTSARQPGVALSEMQQ